MKPAQSVALVAVVLLAALVAFLAFRTRQPPLLPADEDHARFSDVDECLECHGSDGGLPRSENHPIGNDCLRCHGAR